MPPVLVHKSTGQPAKEGDIVTDFRGDEAIFVRGELPRSPNSTGRVYVKQLDGNGDEPFGFYPSVFGLEWQDVDEEHS